jgi:hypothetical protein
VIQLAGKGQNRFGIGARLRLTAGGRTQVREMHAGSGFLSSPPPEAHFGLAAEPRIERLDIRWPSGRTQTLRDLPANRILVVEEDGAWRELVPAPARRP